MPVLEAMVLLNEANYHRQSEAHLLFNYMRVAFAGVMAEKKSQHRIKGAEKKLKPKRTWSYTAEKDEEIIEEIDSMEKFLKNSGKIKAKEEDND